MSLSISSIVNVPGEWTLRREFLRLQTEDHEGGRDVGRGGGGGGQRGQQVVCFVLCSFVHMHINFSKMQRITCDTFIMSSSLSY